MMILADRDNSEGQVTLERDDNSGIMVVEVKTHDPDGCFCLYPSNGKEGLQMFYHPYAYREVAA